MNKKIIMSIMGIGVTKSKRELFSIIETNEKELKKIKNYNPKLKIQNCKKNGGK